MIAMQMPADTKREDGSSRFAYVTFVMMNDSYVPGALLMAYGLRRQWTEADLVCLVTPEITADACDALRVIYDHVIVVETVYVPHKRRHERRELGGAAFITAYWRALSFGYMDLEMIQ